MYSILDRYIGGIVFYNIVVVLFVLLSLSSIIRFVDELRKVGQGCYGVIEVSIYVFLSISKDFEFFLPIGIFLGALLGLTLLLIRRELVIMEVCGFSHLRMSFSLVKTAFPIIFLGIFNNELVVPVSERLARNYRYNMINNVSVRTYNDLWVKDGNDFVYIEKVLQYDELLGIYVYHFDGNRDLKRIRHIRHAKFIDGVWNVFNVNEFCFNSNGYVGVFKRNEFDDVWLSAITPHYLLMTVMSLYYSTSLSVFDLHRCILFFKHHGQNVVQYQLFFWKKIFFPISVIVMMLAALSCILKSLLYKLSFVRQVIVGIIYGFFFML